MTATALQTRWLQLRAPFAAFRWMQAGSYRATSPVIPPSAAWGLLLNLAAIETRGDTSEVSTPIRPDVPSLQIALGVGAKAAGHASLYQQLHGYPVGAAAGRELKAGARGAKYQIAPGRREILLDFECFVGVRSADSDLLNRMAAGLRGDLDGTRYGLPFAGDNSLLFDRIEFLDGSPACRWYERIDGSTGTRPDSCRLTIGIDRADASKTTSALFAPTPEPSRDPPVGAWNWVPGRPPEEP